eukprot:4137473-Amphidinium_carterae.1
MTCPTTSAPPQHMKWNKKTPADKLTITTIAEHYYYPSSQLNRGYPTCTSQLVFNKASES